MKCSICDRKITHCDECGTRFQKGDPVFCDEDDFDKHKCESCYNPAEEGIVE